MPCIRTTKPWPMPKPTAAPQANRVGSAPAKLQDLPQSRSRSRSGTFFVDYQPPQSIDRQRTDFGTWRGPGRNHGRGHHDIRSFFQPIQAQPHGGITRCTSPGFVPGITSNNTSQPPPPYGGVYGASYLPGGLSPQYGYPQYFEPSSSVVAIPDVLRRSGAAVAAGCRRGPELRLLRTQWPAVFATTAASVVV